MTTTHADKVAYCQCMEQVKRRVRILSTITDRRVSVGDEQADSEFACLQLRKILEQLAFASLAASRTHYATMRPRVEREWRAKTILETLSKVHPDFYPVPVVPTRLGPQRVEFQPRIDGFLTKEDFVFLYDRCSEAIHDWNPFKEGARVVELQRPIAEWSLRVQNLLTHHYIRLLGEPDLLVVEMADENGMAHVLDGTAQAG